MLKKTYNRYETMKFQLDSDEKKQVGLHIISSRQKNIEELNTHIKNIEKRMREECPKLAAQLTVFEKRLSEQKKYLKDTIAGIKREPYVVVADVIVQPSIKPGYLEFIENTGSAVLLMEEPGTEENILIPEEELEEE